MQRREEILHIFRQRERERERERGGERKREVGVTVFSLPQSVVRLEVGACTDQPKSAILMSP
jgi:hypothetical protein